MKVHWTDDELIAEVRRMKEKGHSEGEAVLLVFMHGIEPLMELLKDDLDSKMEVVNYEESRRKMRREAREKRERERQQNSK